MLAPAHHYATTGAASDRGPATHQGDPRFLRGRNTQRGRPPFGRRAKSARRSGIASVMAACGEGMIKPLDLSGCQRCCAHGRKPLAENPGRVTDRGLLCWAVLGERGGPPSRIIQGYDQIVRCSARDLSQCSAGLTRSDVPTALNHARAARMTQVVEISAVARRGSEERVMGLVGAAHFASHYFILLLPPLFPFLRKEYDVSYTDLGLALAAFNIVSAVFQTPAGFFTDRIGAHTILVAGLLCSGLSLGLAGVVPWFWFVVAMFGVAGLGNTVYHPADYAILSHHISTQRIGSAYSIHTFAGMLGAAVAPGSLLLIEHWLGWRWAFGSAPLLGGAVAAALMLQRKVLVVSPEGSSQVARSGRVDHSKWQLLMSPPLLRNLLLFVMLALIGGGLQNYSVVALVAARTTALPVADVALTGYLLLTALGVLLGGLVAARTSRHDTVAAVGLLAVAAAVTPIAFVDPNATMLIALMAIAGLFSGLIMPSRDMIVRARTPPGAFGTVFGFVTTGFNIGGIVAPLLFGWVMDHGYARAIFLLSAGFCLLSIVVLVAGRSGEREEGG